MIYIPRRYEKCCQIFLPFHSLIFLLWQAWYQNRYFAFMSISGPCVKCQNIIIFGQILKNYCWQKPQKTLAKTEYYLPLGLLLGELYALTRGMQEWYPHSLCASLFIQSGLHDCAGLQRPNHQACCAVNCQKVTNRIPICIVCVKIVPSHGLARWRR